MVEFWGLIRVELLKSHHCQTAAISSNQATSSNGEKEALMPNATNEILIGVC